MPPGGCVPTVDPATGKVVGWRCYGDLEARYFAMLAAEQEAEYEALREAWELEWSQEANATLFDREPEMWAHREDTDPDWPPPEVDPFEVQYPEIIG